MQVVGRIRSSCALQVHKVTSTSGEGFLIKRLSICTNVLLIRSFSVTSRRGPPTSRRQFHMSLSRRDVDLHVVTCIFTLSATSRHGFQRRDVKLTPLCHVATWISNVATWILMSLWNVATLILDVATLLIPLSATS